MNVKDITKILIYSMLVVVCVGMYPIGALAEGDGDLGSLPSSITIAPGTKLLAAGTGMVNEPGLIYIDVPSGATVEQVLLYWVGRGFPPDDSIEVNGNTVSGTLIGSEGLDDYAAYGYRADITNLDLVSQGLNTLTITEMEFGERDDGASVLVIIKDGPVGFIDIRDGMDYAYWDRAGQLQVTTKETFTFPSATIPRSADLILLLGDGTPLRPDRIEITIGGTTNSYPDLAVGSDGPEWDTIIRQLDIPAGVTEVSVQLFSDDIPGEDSDSLSWVAAALSIPLPPPPGTGTPGYWKNHPDAWPVDEITIGGETYTKVEAIDIMNLPVKGDKTLTMFPHLVSAKLNVLIGNPDDCIAGTIEDADDWMVANPLGSGVKGNSDAWNIGEPLSTKLDKYNNGELCAPHRD